MKVIDLLNKIANGEEVPKKFKFAHQIFEVDRNCITDEDGSSIFESIFDDFSNINDEIGLIEEKEIEELEKDVEYIEHPEKEYPDRIEKRYYYDKDKMGDKINELVKELNKIKKEGK